MNMCSKTAQHYTDCPFKLTTRELLGQVVVKILCSESRRSSSSVTVEHGEVRHTRPADRGDTSEGTRQKGHVRGDTSERRTPPSRPRTSCRSEVLHLSRQSGQTAAHVRQQHVSVLHLLPLAAPRRHEASERRETCNTTRPSASKSETRQSSSVIREKKRQTLWWKS